MLSPALRKPLYTTAFIYSKRIWQKTECRTIDPNRKWEIKADSQIFLICIGRAEIKHVLGLYWPISCKLESYSHKAFLQYTLHLLWTEQFRVFRCNARGVVFIYNARPWLYFFIFRRHFDAMSPLVSFHTTLLVYFLYCFFLQEQ